MRGALFLVLYLSMIPAALSAAHVGMMFYMWASLIAPNIFTYGQLEFIPYSKIAIAVAFIAILNEKTRIKVYFDAYFLFVIAFVLQCVISFSFSITHTDQFYTVADRGWKIAILCFLMNPALKGRLQIHSVVLVIGVTMGVQGAMEGLKYLISGGGHVMFPPGNFGDNNSFGLFVLMTLPLLMYLFRYTVNPFVRLAILGVLLINVITVIGTGSRGAFLGIVAVSLALIAQSKRRIPILFLIVAIGSAIALFVPDKVFQRIDTIETANEDGSFISRVRVWKLSTLVALDRPMTGGGFSSMEDMTVWTAYLPKFSSFDFIPTGPPDKPRAAHSIYFQTLGDTGFTGLFLYLGILGSTFLSIRRIRKMTVSDPALSWAYDLAGYLRLAMFAFVISGAALSVTFYDLPFIIFTLVSILRHTVQDQSTELQKQKPNLERRIQTEIWVNQKSSAFTYSGKQVKAK